MTTSDGEPVKTYSYNLKQFHPIERFTTKVPSSSQYRMSENVIDDFMPSLGMQFGNVPGEAATPHIGRTLSPTRARRYRAQMLSGFHYRKQYTRAMRTVGGFSS